MCSFLTRGFRTSSLNWTDKASKFGSNKNIGSKIGDEKLLEEIVNSDDTSATSDILDTRMLRRMYGEQIQEFDANMKKMLELKFKEEIPKVKSYNEAHGIDALQRMKVNPVANDNLLFSDFISLGILEKAVSLYLNSKEPTEFQKRLLALMTGYLSTIAKGDQGSGGMDFIKIANLSAIFVDDFDCMVDPETYIDTKRQLPIVQLLSYVVKLQDYRRSHNEPHPQLVFTVSNLCTDQLKCQIRDEMQWFDWDRYADIGLYNGATDLPSRKGIATNIGVSCVLVNPYISGESKNGSKFKVQLFDMTPFQYGNFPEYWKNKIFRCPHGNDGYYRKVRNVKKSRMTSEVREMSTKILIYGFNKLVKKVDGLKNEKILVVFPDDVSDKTVLALLNKSKIRAKLYNPSEDSTFFLEADSNEQSSILLIHSGSLTSLTFNGLRNIVVLGLNTIRDCNEFITLAGRLRYNPSGLVPAAFYPPFGETSKGPVQCRIYILHEQPDFEFVERNFLERAFIRSGLVQQFSAVGVSESGFDRKRYDEEFKSDYEFHSQS
ncbi:hypothetical protein HII12_002400 [Brettanomyces bruxellensis]|uniref:Uncharacterized protein n=1 Tax=Dekkera bruxellensis TaxID=5007 RepID=A0A8H6EW19_DEKBR|nr:hypothetical protein HII12_002400 [Brettanomyces bruxellensis]